MKTILITGANRGIGFEFVKQHAVAGWKVIACCREPEQAADLKNLAAANKNIIIMPLDVSNEESIRHLGTKLANETIDILLNNAGIFGARNADFGHLETASWLDVFKTNTIGPALVSQALVKAVAASELKIIANMSSSLGSIAENIEDGYYYYRTSKAALNMLTKNLAVGLRSKNIIVVALDPGWVQTDMGGKGAMLSPTDSVKGLRSVLSSLTAKDTGVYINHAGKKINW